MLAKIELLSLVVTGHVRSIESCEFIYENNNFILDDLKIVLILRVTPLSYVWTKVDGPEIEFQYIDDSSILL